MTTKPKFKSDALAAIHTSATALQKVGAIDQTTLRKFDVSCLVTVEMSRARRRRTPPQGTP